MHTREVSPETALNDELRRLYETAFPKEEQIPYTDIVRLMHTMPIHYSAYYDDQTLVGLTMVMCGEKLNWLWYFAVSESLRGRGYGSHILTSLKQHYSGKLLIIDIESPLQECENQEQRRRRHAFYLRNGFRDTPTAKSFEGIDYTIMATGEGSFTQHDYDEIIGRLRQYWDKFLIHNS